MLSGCFGVPEDSVVEHISVKAWGGSLASCQEMQVFLLDETVARGGCNAIDPANAQPVDPGTIDAIEAGVSASQFSAQDVPPACDGCPTHSYTLLLSSASEGASTNGRIVPDQSLLDALVPLSPP